MILVEIELTSSSVTVWFTLLFITFWDFWKVERRGLSLLNTPMYGPNYFFRIFSQERERDRERFSYFLEHSISGHRCCFRPLHWSFVVSSNVSYTISRQLFAICDWISAADCSPLLFYIINPEMVFIKPNLISSKCVTFCTKSFSTSSRGPESCYSSTEFLMFPSISFFPVIFRILQFVVQLSPIF